MGVIGLEESNLGEGGRGRRVLKLIVPGRKKKKARNVGIEEKCLRGRDQGAWGCTEGEQLEPKQNRPVSKADEARSRLQFN